MDKARSLDGTPSHADGEAESTKLQFPVETDIFIQPDGSVVIADLPEELQSLLARLNASRHAPQTP